MVKRKVRITVEGAGLSYKGTVSENVAGQIISWCLANTEEGETVAQNLEALSPGSSRQYSVPESASEYFNRHAPKRNPDKILTLACFLKEVRKQESFNAKEIRNLFREVGEMLPANFKRDFAWASRRNGWITKEPNSKDSYYVTNTGLRALQAGFSQEILEKTKITARSKNRSKKVKR